MLAMAAAIWSSSGIAASTTQTIQASGDSVWQTVAQRPASIQARTNLTGPSALVRLNKLALDTLLARAPAESELASTNAVVFSIPRADGTFARFRVAESPILAPELAAAFPEIRTYTGQGIDDPDRDRPIRMDRRRLPRNRAVWPGHAVCRPLHTR